MSWEGAWPWVGLFLLGAYHGVNPGMGWLFAVALGMQERRRAAVWSALLPITLGHALAVGLMVLLAALAGLVLPLRPLRYAVAAILVTLGLYRLARQRHLRWGGMRVGMADLTLWSFLMASAHGAGVMVLPIVVPLLAGEAAHAHPHGTAPAPEAPGLTTVAPGDMPVGLAATLVHAAGYLLLTGAASLVVYEKLGVAFLRTAWVNLDRIWVFALLLTGMLTLFAGNHPGTWPR